MVFVYVYIVILWFKGYSEVVRGTRGGAWYQGRCVVPGAVRGTRGSTRFLNLKFREIVRLGPAGSEIS